MTGYRYIDVRPVSGALGAEVEGVDASREVPDEVVAEVRRAFLEHLVIVLRGQKLEPGNQRAFARRFGRPVIYPFVKGVEGFPEVTPVIKSEQDRTNFGGIWHSDTTYLPKPPLGSMLYAREVPPAGGDTEFANMYLAWNRLSPGMQRMLSRLSAVSISGKGRARNTRSAMLGAAGTGLAEDSLSAIHPVARRHPETGRTALYVNVAHTSHFEGMTVEESASLLDFLFAHLSHPEFTCRFRWEPGTLAFWDNCCTQHNALNDYQGFRREMHRITLEGDSPVAGSAVSGQGGRPIP